jgi:hypothetical protein
VSTAINLRYAMICLDCDNIGLEATHCMVCGSRQVTSLAKWIPPKDKMLSAVELQQRRDALIDECEGLAQRMQDMMSEIEACPLEVC